MSLVEQIDRDLRNYLSKADNLRNEDKLNMLKSILASYLDINKMDHMVTSSDLFSILSDAKGEFVKLPTNPQISGKVVPRSDFVGISVIEAFTTYLNRNDLLKRMPVIDYTDSSSEYEELE